MHVLPWFLLALPLALDVFAVGLVFGLAGLERSRWPGIALTFGVIGGVLIGVGLLLGDALQGAVGTVALYIAGMVLLAIGVLAISRAVRSGDAEAPSLSGRQIATTALAVAVDKFAVGLSFAVLEAHVGTMVVIVAGQTFAAALIGMALGKRLGTRAGHMAEIVAGLVFTGLGVVILYQALVNRG